VVFCGGEVPKRGVLLVTLPALSLPLPPESRHRSRRWLGFAPFAALATQRGSSWVQTMSATQLFEAVIVFSLRRGKDGRPEPFVSYSFPPNSGDRSVFARSVVFTSITALLLTLSWRTSVSLLLFVWQIQQR
jgi:hypothetical protein